MSNTKNIIAVETSRPDASLVLRKGDESFRLVLSEDQKQGSELLPLLKKLFDEADVKPDQIGDIVIHTGPGSATGLRMGIAMVQAYAMVHPEVQVHSVPLEDLALQYLRTQDECQNQKQAMLLVDAFGGSIFVQNYENYNGTWLKKDSIEEMARNDVQAIDGEYFIVDALGVLKEKVEWSKTWQWSTERFPDAEYVMQSFLSDSDYHIDVKELDVRYLKATSAELNWKKKNS